MSETLQSESFQTSRRFVAVVTGSILLAGCGLKVEAEPLVQPKLPAIADIPVTETVVSAPQPLRAFMLESAPPPAPKTVLKPTCTRVNTPAANVASTQNLASFVRVYSPLASKVEAACGVPHEVTLAQAFHESDGGRSGLSRNHKNMFGIKAKQGAFGGWNGPVTVQKTQEHYTQAELDQNPPCAVNPQPLESGKFLVTICAAFRAYDSPEESFMDYGYHLRNRGSTALGEFYADAFKETDPQKFLQAILDDDDGPLGPQKSYATDERYVQKVSRYIKIIQELEG